MIIGVDGGTLSITDERLKVGVYRVVYNLLKELGKIDTTNTYRLYSFLPLDHALLRTLGKHVENIVLTPQKGWFSWRLPLELTVHPVDVFLGVAQAMPKVAVRSIGFIYDLSFLFRPGAYPDAGERLKAQTHQLVQRSTHIVAISQATADDIYHEYHLTKDVVTVLYPGVDKRFTPRGEIYTSKNPYFLFVGSLNRTKNIPLLLEAFAHFLQTSKKRYDMLLVGGDFWPDPAINETIEKLQLKDRVHKTGYVSDEKLPMYYRGAIAFIATSFREGFCLPAAEALSCATPVIATNAGALPEIVADAGLITHSTPRELSDAMLILSQNLARRKKLSTLAIKRAKNFRWDLFAQGVLHQILINEHTRQ